MGGGATAILLSNVPRRALMAQRDALTLIDPEMRKVLAEQKVIAALSARVRCGIHELVVKHG